MSLAQALLDQVLVLVAHPDDEAVACGTLLQRASEALVVYATDGAPRDAYFWQQYGTREAYALVRRAEAQQALAAIGLERFQFLGGAGFIDQELFRNLQHAAELLSEICGSFRPTAILSLA